MNKKDINAFKARLSELYADETRYSGAYMRDCIRAQTEMVMLLADCGYKVLYNGYDYFGNGEYITQDSVTVDIIPVREEVSK